MYFSENEWVEKIAECRKSGKSAIEDFMRVYSSGLESNLYTNSGDIWFEHIPSEIGLCFFNATLNFDEVIAYITLAHKLNEMAMNQNHTSPKQKPIYNDAYVTPIFKKGVTHLNPTAIRI